VKSLADYFFIKSLMARKITIAIAINEKRRVKTGKGHFSRMSSLYPPKTASKKTASIW